MNWRERLYNTSIETRTKKKTLWQRLTSYTKHKIISTRYKLMSFFIDVESGKEYDPGHLRTHNRKMITDKRYKLSFYYKCFMCKLRYKFISFIVDIILTIIILMLLFIVSVITCLVTYGMMLILIPV